MTATSMKLRIIRARAARILSLFADRAERGEVRAAELFLAAAGVVGVAHPARRLAVSRRAEDAPMRVAIMMRNAWPKPAHTPSLVLSIALKSN